LQRNIFRHKLQVRLHLWATVFMIVRAGLRISMTVVVAIFASIFAVFQLSNYSAQYNPGMLVMKSVLTRLITLLNGSKDSTKFKVMYPTAVRLKLAVLCTGSPIRDC
jgi:hypothetical protein